MPDFVNIQDLLNTVVCGDALSVVRTLPDESISCVVTSPPYWALRSYNVDGQIGLENTPEEYVSKMAEVFREIYRVLKKDGTLWINIADTYMGSWGSTSHDLVRLAVKSAYKGRPPQSRKHPTIKPKDLVGIPWMLAFALRADGYYLRQEIIWHKTNAMPSSVRDRCAPSHESVFLLSKSRRYYFDMESIKEPCTQEEMANGFRGGAYCDHKAFGNEEGGRTRTGNISWKGSKFDDGKNLLVHPTVQKRKIPSGWDTDKGRGHGTVHVEGRSEPKYEESILISPIEKRNKRSVWPIPIQGFKGAHFATFPERLVEPCILAGCPDGGIVLDPFGGSGTTGVVAKKNYRNFILIDLNPKYVEMAKARIAEVLVNRRLDFGGGDGR